MPRPRKYPEELLERGVRLVFESERPIAHLARDLGIHPEALRKRVRQAEADVGKRSDLLTSQEREEIGKLRRENYELRRPTRSSSRRAFFSPPSSTRTDRSERVHREAPPGLRGRADLLGPGRLGGRLLRAGKRAALGASGRGRAPARRDPQDPQAKLRGLRLPAHLEGPAASRRAGAALPRCSG